MITKNKPCSGTRRGSKAIFFYSTLLFSAGLLTAAPLSPAITYRGQIQQAGSPPSGFFDFRFSLYDDAEGGALVGSTVATNAVPVTNGVFLVPLDFGAGAFNGDARWLQVGVRTNGSAEDFTMLSPRQQVPVVPYALTALQSVSGGALSAGSITSGTLADARLSSNVVLLNADGKIPDTFLSSNLAWVTGAAPVAVGDGSRLTNLNPEAFGPPGTFSLLPPVFTMASTNPVAPGPYSVAVADVNGDGWPDLISAGYNGNAITVLTNNRTGGFAEARTYGFESSSPLCVVAADVNFDGWVDIISANSGNPSLTILTNDGSGGFAMAAALRPCFYPSALAVADVNGDAWPDLICLSYSDYVAVVLTNGAAGGWRTGGDATFATAGAYYAGYYPSALTTADVNKDGWPDLICGSGWERTLQVLTNTRARDNQFDLSATLNYWPDGGPTTVVATDVNNDGWVDVVTVNASAGTLTVLTNDRSGGLHPAATLTVGGDPRAVVAADINTDGWVDLVCASTLDNSLSVWTNNHSGGFALATTVKVGLQPRSVAVADVNGDGRSDLISANSAANTLSVLFGGPLLSARLNGAFEGSFNGTLAGNITGNVIGNVTGSVTGDGAGLTNVPGSNVIGFLTWQTPASLTIRAMPNTGYLITNNGSGLFERPADVYLPASPQMGDVVRVSSLGTAGWRVNQNPGQTILAGPVTLADKVWTPHETVQMWNCVASSADGTKLVTAQFPGQIYTSTDSGKTWTPRPSVQYWHAVASSADGTKLIAAIGSINDSADDCKRGYLWTSTDSGVTWTQRSENQIWSSVASSADGNTLAAAMFLENDNDGNYGSIYTSLDGGTNWTKHSGPIGYLDAKPYVSIALSGDGSRVYGISKDRGSSYYWSQGILGFYVQPWNSFLFTKSQGQGGAVATSYDGAKLFAGQYGDYLITSTGDPTVGGVKFTWAAERRQWGSIALAADCTRVLAAEWEGRLYTTSDAGVTWCASEGIRRWSGVASSADGKKLVAVDQGGLIYTWSENPSPDGGGLAGEAGAAIELQYLGSGQWRILSHTGRITTF